jgi:hypothetical protein
MVKLYEKLFGDIAFWRYSSKKRICFRRTSCKGIRDSKKRGYGRSRA